MTDQVKNAFLEGYGWCLSEQGLDWEHYAEDCEDCWAVSDAKNLYEEEKA